MRGDLVASALSDRFESIRRAEIARLRKKLAPLSAADRAEVEAITAQVVQAIAAVPASALAREESPVLIRAVVDLFRVS